MKIKRSFPLSFWLPVYVAAALLALLCLTTFHEYRHLTQEQVDDSKNFTNHNLAMLQIDLLRDYQAGDSESARAEIVSSASLPGTEILIVVDNLGRIKDSVQPTWEGRLAKDVFSSFQPELFAAVQKDRLPISILDPQQQRIFAYHPIQHLSENTSAPQELLGVIFLTYQFPYSAKDLWLQALHPDISTELLFALTMVILIGLLHRFVVRPARQLVAITKAIAAGEMTSSPAFKGHGEFAQVGKAMYQMGEKLQGQQLQQLQVEHELRHREGLLREAQQIAQVGHYHLDFQSEKWTGSGELNQIFGIDDDYERTTQSWLDLVHPDEQEALAEYLQHEVLELVQPFDREYRIITRSTGETKWVHGFGRLKINSDRKATEMFGTIQDITTRKQNDAALVEANNIINRSPAVAFLWKYAAGWPVEYVTENVASIFGYNAADFLEGHLVYESLIHQDDLDLVHAETENFLSEGKYDSFTQSPYRIVTKGGEHRWVLDHTHTRVNSKGEVTHFEGLITDITEIQSQKILTEFLARRAKTLLEIPEKSEQLEDTELLQYSLQRAEEFTGSSISFLHFVNEDEQTIQLAAWSKRTIEKFCKTLNENHYPVRQAGIWADALRQRRPIISNDYANYQGKNGLPEGHAELHRLISLPVMENGKVVMLIGIGNKADDYTERDVETLQLFANQVWGLAQRRHADLARNQALHEMKERVKELHVLHKVATTIETHRDIRTVLQKTVDFIPPGWQYPALTCARIRYNGEDFTSKDFAESIWKQCATLKIQSQTVGVLEVYYREERPPADEGPFLSEERALLEDLALAIGLAMENTLNQEARLIAERQLLQAQKMEAVGQLTGGIAHDFNNILCIILGNVDLLEMDLKGEGEMLSRVQAIGKSAQRAADLTKQMLGFSQRQATTIDPTNINTVIVAMRNLIVRTLTPKIAVVMDLQENLWASALDSADFEDALLNLILNARDAMPKNGELSIETSNFIETNNAESATEPGEFVQLLIRDNGEGISYDAQEHIFEPFFTTKATGEGAGLGLAMVYGFVQRSGGHIYCESEPNVGTTFTIRLPRCFDSVADPCVVLGEGDAAPRGTETILIVDDEADLVEIATQTLQSLGYCVITAAHGAEAMEQLRRHPNVDLLFSDVVMPGGINGYQLATQARAQFPHLRILIASGYTEDAVVQGQQHTLRMELLRKPYSQKKMAFEVRAALDGPETSDELASGVHSKPRSSQAAFNQTWTPNMAIGVAILDDDHQLLMQLISHGMQLADTPNGLAKAGFILRELHAYSESHFEREEVVMAACNYPELVNHRHVHQMLLRKLEQMRVSQEQGQLRTTDFTDFLVSWWDDHVRILDRAMAPYCVGKGALIEQALERYFSAKSAENPA